MTSPLESSTRRKLPVLLDDPRMELDVFIQLMRTYSRLERQAEKLLESQGLSLPQFDVLATLRHGQGITQQELAERLLVTKGNVCALIDRMEAGGWVQRRADPEDRRANRLFLTRSGKALLAKAMPPHHEKIREMLGVLSKPELQKFHQLLDQIETAIEEKT
jgi:DNA-binding MarR family transcriptional regulator